MSGLTAQTRLHLVESACWRTNGSFFFLFQGGVYQSSETNLPPQHVSIIIILPIYTTALVQFHNNISDRLSVCLAPGTRPEDVRAWEHTLFDPEPGKPE